MSDRYFCTNCWETSAGTDLLYRCPACGDPDLPEWLRETRGLRPVRDLRPRGLKRWLHPVDETALACPHHPVQRLESFCPVCRAPIGEASAIRGAPMALGVAGPQSAGKTLYILSLLPELRRREVGGQPLGLVGIDTTDQRFEALAARLRCGEKPEPTSPRSPAQERDLTMPVPSNFCWQVQTAGPNRRTPPAFLALYDVAGETWGLPTHQALARFDRYLSALTSLVFLIDGAAVARDLDLPVEDAWEEGAGSRGGAWADTQWLSHTQARLGKRARRVDLALVLAKADHLWDHPDWSALRPGAATGNDTNEALRRLLFASGRGGLWSEAYQSFRQMQLFSVSSVGFRPGPEDVRKHQGAAPTLLRPLAPMGVTEPVVWLLRNRIPALLRDDAR